VYLENEYLTKLNENFLLLKAFPNPTRHIIHYFQLQVSSQGPTEWY